MLSRKYHVFFKSISVINHINLIYFAYGQKEQ